MSDCMLVKGGSPEASDLAAWHDGMCHENSPKSGVNCVGSGSPKQVKSSLIYSVLLFPFEYKLEPVY